MNDHEPRTKEYYYPSCIKTNTRYITFYNPSDIPLPRAKDIQNMFGSLQEAILTTQRNQTDLISVHQMEYPRDQKYLI